MPAAPCGLSICRGPPASPCGLPWRAGYFTPCGCLDQFEGRMLGDLPQEFPRSVCAAISGFASGCASLRLRWRSGSTLSSIFDANVVIESGWSAIRAGLFSEGCAGCFGRVLQRHGRKLSMVSATRKSMPILRIRAWRPVVGRVGSHRFERRRSNIRNATFDPPRRTGGRRLGGPQHGCSSSSVAV